MFVMLLGVVCEELADKEPAIAVELATIAESGRDRAHGHVRTVPRT